MPVNTNNSPEKYEDIHFVDSTKPVWNYSLFSDEDIKNFQQGTHYQLYELFGNKQLNVLQTNGTYFAVWAPNATQVSVIGNFNNWNNDSHKLFVRMDHSGIWEGFIPHITAGETYKYHIHGYAGTQADKGDPFLSFVGTETFNSLHYLGNFFEWQDEQWMQTRHQHNALNKPWSIYEVHLASWMRPDKKQ